MALAEALAGCSAADNAKPLPPIIVRGNCTLDPPPVPKRFRFEKLDGSDGTVRICLVSTSDALNLLETLETSDGWMADAWARCGPVSNAKDASPSASTQPSHSASVNDAGTDGH